MIKPLSFLLLLVLAGPSFAADDIRSKVSKERDDADADELIDPDKSIFGIPLGTTEDDFIKKNGKPAGYLDLKGQDTAMLYGNNYAFLFEHGKLAGVLLTYSTVDHQLAKRLVGSRFSQDARSWKLSNGIESEMTLPEVRNIVGAELTAANERSLHSQYFLTGKSRVELSFSRRSDKAQDDEEAYKLMGVLITPKSSKIE